MHYSFHSTPTTTFKSRNESIKYFIKQLQNLINYHQFQDLQIIKLKNHYLIMEMYQVLLKTEIYIKHSNLILDQEPINLNHISLYYIFLFRMV